jgi:hypothetical protein
MASTANDHLIIKMDKENNGLDYYSNHLSLKDLNYLKQNIYSYWISSSHNTYLPYGQIFDPSSECYYKLILSVYFGGCVEIDTDSISTKPIDVIITHLPTNTKSIGLRGILRTVISALETKESRGIVSGPVILTFDNKKLKTKSDYTIFWTVIEEELLTEKNYKYVAVITDKYDLRTIELSSMSNKILLRWAENENCDGSSDKVGKELCPPKFSDKVKDSQHDYNYSKTTDHWVHLLKGHSNFSKSIAIDKEEFLNEGTQNSLYRKPNPNFGLLVNNETKSVSVPMSFTYTPSNYNLVVNLQRNIMRMFPHLTYTMSQNYSNIVYFRNGIQITALNLQYISDPWYLNRAVFMPKTGVPCTPKEMKENKNLCKSGWKQGNTEDPLAYRLKPLSLLGLIPNQGLYILSLTVTKCSRISVDPATGNVKLDDVSSEYKKVNLKYGLTNAVQDNISVKSPVLFGGIDVSVPFFVLEVVKPAIIGKSSIYKTGIEIPWSLNNSGADAKGNSKVNKITVDVYKIVKTMLGSLNKVDLSDNCENSQLFNTPKQLRVELEYSWTFSSEIKEMAAYNNAVKALRQEYKKPISYFLENLTELNKFQKQLAENLAGIPSTVAVVDGVDEDKQALQYEKDINEVKGTAKLIDTSNTSED